MNMFKPTAAKTPEEYIEMIDQPRKDEIKKLFEFIKKIDPNKKPFIISGMIGFGNYHYKYKSGKEGDWAIVGLASQKNYISVYICSTDTTEYIVQKYKNQFPKADIGKGCIRFKKLEDINLDILKKIIKEGYDSQK